MKHAGIIVWALLVAALMTAIVSWKMTAHSGVTLVLSRVVAVIGSWFLGAAVGVAFADRENSRALLIATLTLSIIVFALGFVAAVA